ncbi:pyridoxal kinase [Cylas formicarius]|uniref:pyridoxal kinase n=1 Tax=Cylas formicarius TaxID=197179 RepID=UPI0029587E96|nr:pyridoxal kinase [Cylas formicarius]
MESPRVLSIQSHVVSGYVGNKSSVFPMQLLGFEVDIINSVQFSNHTGYKSVKGQVLTEKELSDLILGLSENDIDHYTHLLTGYIGSPSFLREIINLYKQVKSKNPDVIYVCDPVMGDNGKLYVPTELIPIYKNSIVPLADILTPNLFETELLTDMKINTVTDVWAAIKTLHERGCKTVVISSAELASAANKLCIFGSSVKSTPVKLTLEVIKLPALFTGSGDLFTALLMSFLHISNGNLKDSIEKTVAALQAVLTRTLDQFRGKELKPQNMELKLIQSRDDILNPKIVYRATVED